MGILKVLRHWFSPFIEWLRLYVNLTFVVCIEQYKMTSEIGKFVETLVKDEQKDLVSSVEDNHVDVISKREDIGVQPLPSVKNITKELLLIESEKDGMTTQESVMKFPTLTNTTESLNINSIDNNNRKHIECSNSNIVVNG
ncbi:traB domain-containing protein isoform X1 [Vespula squamosa]|uniref:TraB domain-containing protein isoform X1 n=1 Tax=Vespula squamosa TaxID=30214 RepID=A0ABD2B9W3_VESSQ